MDKPDLEWVALMVAEELAGIGIDNIAVLDFTDPYGNTTEFERTITEQITVEMIKSGRGLWVVSGGYLRNLLSSQESNKTVWNIIGVDAVVSGIVAPKKDGLSLALKIVDATTAEIINEFAEECQPMSMKHEIAAAQPIQARSIEQKIPTFPWPPPEASASARIPSNYLIKSATPATLFDAANALEDALNQTGYGERSYYAVPEGFALVTRLEQIHPDGTSKNPPDRWAVSVSPPREFSLSTYLKSLFTAEEGHFRIIAFIVTSSAFFQMSETPVSQDEAINWVTSGVQPLPQAIGQLPYTQYYYCVALIYEFEQQTRNHKPVFKKLSPLPGIDHLKGANIWEELGE